MKYSEKPLPYHLIRNCWHFQVDIDAQQSQHTIIPDSSTNLILHLHPNPQHHWAQIIGPFTSGLTVPIFKGSHYYGLRFFPGEFNQIFNFPAKSFKNERFLPYKVHPTLYEKAQVLLKTISPNTYHTDFEKFLTHFQLPSLEANQLERSIIQLIIQEGGYISNDQLSGQFQLSERQLQRRIKAFSGLSLKELRSIEQVRKGIADIGVNDKSIIDSALINNYFDQQHFSNKIKAVMGDTPKKIAQYFQQIEYGDLIF